MINPKPIDPVFDYAEIDKAHVAIGKGCGPELRRIYFNEEINPLLSVTWDAVTAYEVGNGYFLLDRTIVRQNQVIFVKGTIVHARKGQIGHCPIRVVDRIVQQRWPKRTVVRAFTTQGRLLFRAHARKVLAVHGAKQACVTTLKNPSRVVVFHEESFYEHLGRLIEEVDHTWIEVDEEGT